MPTRSAPPRPVLWLCAAAAALPGCIEERVPVRPLGQAPTGVAPSPRGIPVAPPSSPAQAQSGTGPALTQGAARVLVRGLGEVAYDGRTLPVVSPDGRHLATQVGAAPPWGVSLGIDAEPAPLSAVRVHTVDRSGVRPAAWSVIPPAGAPQRARGPDPAPAPDEPTRGLSEPGLLLGRGATNQGVLVEQATTTGGRRIGLLSWQTGQVRWVTPEREHLAHAIPMDEPGTLVAVRRSQSDQPSPVYEVVQVGQDGSMRAVPLPGGAAGEWPLLPVRTGDGAWLGVLSATPPTLDALGRVVEPARLVLVIAGRDASGAWRVARRVPVAGSADPAGAYQALASIDAAPGPDSGARLGLFEPGAGRCAVIDPATGSVTRLPSGSVSVSFAAAGSGDAPGSMLLYTDRGGLRRWDPGAAPVTLSTLPIVTRSRPIGAAQGSTEPAPATGDFRGVLSISPSRQGESLIIGWLGWTE
ncbi:MAG: hypothetical protein C0475_05370 [Planctomyces sp.]|nr:hypothetical protein [Planctomyces sp.]